VKLVERRALLLAAVLALWSLASAVPSLADADPASDVLLGAPAFFPYQPAVSQALQAQLQRDLAQLQKQGLNLKVAIIESPVDLGAIPNMFGRPQAYAEFLDREISFNQPQPLVVVMPQGFGVSHAGSPSALGGVKIDTAHRSDGLTASAILAVQQIARGAGKSVSGGRVPVGGGSAGGGTSPLLTFGGPAILVALGALVAARFHRRGPR
jgi:hypothetical protein